MRDLIRKERQYRASADKTEVLRRERNALILAAVKAGARPSDVADAIGVTRARVAQILSNT